MDGCVSHRPNKIAIGFSTTKEVVVSQVHVHRGNVGRIAERIVSNELESRGYRVSDLNKEGTSANADLLAAKAGKTWQIQVKGATEDKGWWVNYGFCNDSVISGSKKMFNGCDSFYEAQVVALVCVKSANEYSCVVLPVAVAEKAAQMNLDRYYRKAKKDGSPKKPGPVYMTLDYNPTNVARDKASFEAERELLKPFRDNWDLLMI